MVANAVAALSEINEASPSGRPLIEMNPQTVNKLLTALNECTEWGQVIITELLNNNQNLNIYSFSIFKCDLGLHSGFPEQLQPQRRPRSAIDLRANNPSVGPCKCCRRFVCSQSSHEVHGDFGSGYRIR